MSDRWISLPATDDDAFVHLPPGLDRRRLQRVLRAALERDVTVAGCEAVNLCADQFGGVSNSGATVLHLSVDLADGRRVDVKAKILSPDAVNLFKCDCRFDSRVAEIDWVRWWAEQDASFTPRVYDTRSDRPTREFWVLQEFFPNVGLTDGDSEKQFAAHPDRLRRLFEHVAAVHAHSRQRIDELLGRFSGAGLRCGHLCTPALLLETLAAFLADASFLSAVGLTDSERRVLATCGDAIAGRPAWVDDWDVVCVNRDFSPDNCAVRTDGRTEQLVTFDWGAAHLGPMEEDLEVLLGRVGDLDEADRDGLLDRYLDVYAGGGGRRLERRELMARIPWARLLVTLRYAAEHMTSLRWVPFQTRSRELIHILVGACERLLAHTRTSV